MIKKKKKPKTITFLNGQVFRKNNMAACIDEQTIVKGEGGAKLSWMEVKRH